MSERKKPWTQGPWRWRFAGSAGQWRLLGANNEHVVSGGSPGLVPADEPDMALQAAAPELVDLVEKYRSSASLTVDMDAGPICDLHEEADELLAKIHGDET